MAKKIPDCPMCGRRARLLDARFNKKYGCCGLWSWGLKALVDGETHRARNAAHAAFDPLWQKHGYSRSDAYHALAEVLGVPEEEAHMSIMPKELAQRVPAAVVQIMSRVISL